MCVWVCGCVCVWGGDPPPNIHFIPSSSNSVIRTPRIPANTHSPRDTYIHPLVGAYAHPREGGRGSCVVTTTMLELAGSNQPYVPFLTRKKQHKSSYPRARRGVGYFHRQGGGGQQRERTISDICLLAIACICILQLNLRGFYRSVTS